MTMCVKIEVGSKLLYSDGGDNNVKVDVLAEMGREDGRCPNLWGGTNYVRQCPPY